MRLNGFQVRQRTPPFVIPAKAGIHALTSHERTPSAIPPPMSTRRPHSGVLGPSFRHSGEGRNPEGGRGKRAKHQIQTPPARHHLIRPSAYFLRRNAWYAFTNSSIGVRLTTRAITSSGKSSTFLNRTQDLPMFSFFPLALYALRNHSWVSLCP